MSRRTRMYACQDPQVILRLGPLYAGPNLNLAGGQAWHTVGLQQKQLLD